MAKKNTLIECIDCGHRMSPLAKACPSCGRINRGRNREQLGSGCRARR